MAGGYPSCTNQFVIKRATNIWELFAGGVLPSELDEIDGELEIFTDSIVRTSQRRNDVYRLIAMGGGGYGDPLDREPERVLKDVIAGVVTAEQARERYGVVIGADGHRLSDGTDRRREEIRAERRETASVQSPGRIGDGGAR